MFNSVIICLISDFCTIVLSAFSAFVFSRYKFFGKEFLFVLILSLMIIPSTVTLTPSYLNIINLGLKDNWLGMILPYIAGNQIASIFLFRTFMGQHPDALYEAARIDGAGDFTLFFKICIPMSLPIMIIQAVALFAAIYNDFMWPMLIMDTPAKAPLMPQLKLLASSLSSVTMQAGTEYAVYLLSGIPLVITTILGMKYYINGDFAAGLKL
jgi:multiple sugar transport system permease protein